MRPLKVDFLPRRPVNPWVWIALSAALLAVALQQAYAAWTVFEQTELLDVELSQLRRQADETDQRRREASAQSERSQIRPYARDAAAKAMLAEYPWDQVLRSLESVATQDVKLTKLEVSAVDDVVTAEYEVKDGSALLEMMEHLNAGDADPRWRLQRMQSASKVGEPVTATLISRWR